MCSEELKEFSWWNLILKKRASVLALFAEYPLSFKEMTNHVCHSLRVLKWGDISTSLLNKILALLTGVGRASYQPNHIELGMMGSMARFTSLEKGRRYRLPPKNSFLSLSVLQKQDRNMKRVGSSIRPSWSRRTRAPLEGSLGAGDIRPHHSCCPEQRCPERFAERL